MPDRALAEYRIALAHDLDHPDARYNIGIVLAKDKKNYPATIHIWVELLKKKPNFPYADAIRTSIATMHKGIQKGTR